MDDTIQPSNRSQGSGGGGLPIGSPYTFYPNDPSSIIAEFYIFSNTMVVEKNEKTKHQLRSAHLNQRQQRIFDLNIVYIIIIVQNYLVEVSDSVVAEESVWVVPFHPPRLS